MNVHLNLSGHLFMDLKTVIDSAPTLKSPVEPSRLNLNINLFSNAAARYISGQGSNATSDQCQSAT